MTGRTLMQPVGCITTQVRPIEDDRGGHARRAVPVLPPVFDKLTLVDHMVCQTRPDEGKVPVSINGSHGVAQSRPMNAMNPVDPVEALHDPYPTPARISQLEQMPRPGKDEKRIRRFGRIVGDIHTAGAKSLLEFQAERGHAAWTVNARHNANARHGGNYSLHPR